MRYSSYIAPLAGPPLLPLALLVTLFATQPRVVTSHRCLVCVPRVGASVVDVTSMFPGPPEVQHCDAFQAGDPRFQRNCPPDYNGCLTQINGSLVTRTCSELPINDCKMANMIQYCYCDGDLCNNKSPTSAPNPVHMSEQLPGDDEDQDPLEGSGGGRETERRRPKVKQVTTEILPSATTTASVVTTASPVSSTATRRNVVSSLTAILMSYLQLQLPRFI